MKFLLGQCFYPVYLDTLSMKKSITINHQREKHRIAWFQGASDSSIRETLKETLQLPHETSFVLKDETGAIVALSESLPDGLNLIIELRTAKNNIIIDSGQNKNNTSSNNFRGELLKFERINAHLANERTWLAWVRTALSTLSCAFAFLSLSSPGFYDTLVYILGSLFCLSVLFVYVTGWLRYTRIKLILGLSFNEMKNNFERVGVHWVATTFGGLFIATALMYWTGVFIDIKK